MAQEGCENIRALLDWAKMLYNGQTVRHYVLDGVDQHHWETCWFESITYKHFNLLDASGSSDKRDLITVYGEDERNVLEEGYLRLTKK